MTTGETQQLRRLEEEALARARIGTFEIDLVAGVALWSPVMYELHGVTPGTAPPAGFDVYAPLLHPDDVESLRRAGTQVQRDGGAASAELEIRVRDGEGWRHLHVLLHCGRDPAGRPRYLRGSMQDITGDATLRGELIRDREHARDETRAKSHYLARVTHELRTPLAGVIGMIDLALGDHDAVVRADHLASARASARHLLELIDDLLDASREDTWSINVVEIEFDLGDVLQQALAMVAPRAQRKGLELRAMLDPEVTSSRLGDPLRLRQILVNLLYNAVKFTPGGSVSADVSGDDQQVVIVVQDTGVGIPLEQHASVFQPFVQAAGASSGEGVGLGLAITRELVDAMAGTIELTSTVGVGTRFVVRLPLRAGHGERSDRLRTIDAHSSSGLRPPPVGLRVLVVEDHATNAAIAQAVLERAGHRAHCVGDGDAALATLDAERFDLVLMDLEMPGLDGAGAARRIRAAEHAAGAARMPIVALSAHKRGELAAAAAGMDAFLRKPLDVAAIEAVLARVATGGLRAPVDHDLRLSRVGRRGELARTVAQTFLGHAPGLLDPIDAAISAGDAEELYRGAHGLRAALLMVGAVPASELAAQLEQAVPGEAAELRAQLAAEIARVSAELTLIVDA